MLHVHDLSGKVVGLEGGTQTVLLFPSLGIQLETKFYSFAYDVCEFILNEVFTKTCRVVVVLEMLLTNGQQVVLFDQVRLAPKQLLRAFEILDYHLAQARTLITGRGECAAPSVPAE
ncbi:hypothetical protein BASA81_012433 [Batrachochytrium salamandrivorans]|nr:hypothetical protein BASA81_012433 [Batrachochytrium salamandrivorans]